MSAVTDVIAVSFAGGSLVISGWAGYTAHKAREWQRDRDEERRATHVRVEFAHALSHARESVYNQRYADSPGPEPLYTLTLMAINQGQSTEYVTSAFVEQAAADEEGRVCSASSSIA